LPAINKQEHGGHPAVASRAVDIPDDSDFDTGTYTTVLAPNALNTPDIIESLIMLPPEFEVAVHIDSARWQVEVFLGPAYSSLPSDARTFLLPDAPGAINVAVSHTMRVEFVHGYITAAFMDDTNLAPKTGRS